MNLLRYFSYFRNSIKPSTASEALSKAAELIAQPGGWTKDSYAKDPKGFSVRVMSPSATSFCIMGAVQRTICEGGSRLTSDIEQDVRDAFMDITGDSPIYFNDQFGRTQEEVVSMMRRVAKFA